MISFNIDKNAVRRFIVDKRTKNKDVLMWFIGAVAVLLIIASLGNEIRLAGLERKKVSKISEIAVPEVPDVKTERAYGVVSAAEWICVRLYGGGRAQLYP